MWSIPHFRGLLILPFLHVRNKSDKKVKDTFKPKKGQKGTREMKLKRTSNTAVTIITGIVLVLVVGLIITLGQRSEISMQVLSKYGSVGEEVRKSQIALRDKGFYKGNIDGIFGTQTKNAVIAFQKSVKLTADGIVGPKTLQALGLSGSTGSTSSSKLSESEITLLARIISAESRGEPYSGQVAVGAVVLNRMQHPSFPNTLAGVIYQPGAFSCLKDGQINAPVYDSAKKASRDAVNGWDPSGGAIYYYNPAKTSNKFMISRPVITVIGGHRFCK